MRSQVALAKLILITPRAQEWLEALLWVRSCFAAIFGEARPERRFGVTWPQLYAAAKPLHCAAKELRGRLFFCVNFDMVALQLELQTSAAQSQQRRGVRDVAFGLC